MKHADMIRLPLMVRRILLEHSDEEHAVSMSELKTYLADMGLEAERRSVYKAISVLNQYGEEIVYKVINGKQGYIIRHPFSQAEVFFLNDAVASSGILSEKTASEFSGRITSLLGVHQRKSLPPVRFASSTDHTDNIFETIGILLKAIALRNPVEFRYYDLTVTKKKQYRKANKKYHLVPYALVSNSGRYYCVFHSKEHQSFANYRIDKMDMIHVMEEQEDPVFFSLEDHIRSSFNMYHGDPETVTVKFDLSLANVVFDEFSRNIIISEVGEKRFTASLRSAVTPTLISWLLQFYDRMEVVKPDSLKEKLLEIADTLTETYNAKEE